MSFKTNPIETADFYAMKTRDTEQMHAKRITSDMEEPEPDPQYNITSSHTSLINWNPVDIRQILQERVSYYDDSSGESCLSVPDEL